MELSLSDFYAKCDKCLGTGRYKEMAPPASQGGYGTQRWVSEETCDKCYGNGGTLTENGKVLKEFVELLRTRPSLV